jgi:hypothetical protein
MRVRDRGGPRKPAWLLAFVVASRRASSPLYKAGGLEVPSSNLGAPTERAGNPALSASPARGARGRTSKRSPCGLSSRFGIRMVRFTPRHSAGTTTSPSWSIPPMVRFATTAPSSCTAESGRSRVSASPKASFESCASRPAPPSTKHDGDPNSATGLSRREGGHRPDRFRLTRGRIQRRPRSADL